MGCYGDCHNPGNTQYRDLRYWYKSDTNSYGDTYVNDNTGPLIETIETCFAAAKAQGYKYFGVQFHGQCFLGNSYGSQGALKPPSCNTPCQANGGEICGGTCANSVYGITYPATASPSTTTTSTGKCFCGSRADAVKA